jgi:hypothetical protein
MEAQTLPRQLLDHTHQRTVSGARPRRDLLGDDPAPYVSGTVAGASFCSKAAENR